MKDCPAVSDLDRAEAANDITNIEEEDVSLLTVDQIVSISNDERLKVLANTALDRREAVAHGDELEPLPPKRLKSKASFDLSLLSWILDHIRGGAHHTISREKRHKERTQTHTKNHLHYERRHGHARYVFREIFP